MVPGTPGWRLDELAHAGRENLDADHVARYDAKMDAGVVDEIALLDSLGLSTASTVVDLGCGTGQLAVAAAARCARVIAVDVSPAMLAALRLKAGRAGLRNVDVVQAGFLTYEHAGVPADFVYSRYALHHLPDFWKGIALSRMRALVRPGGVVRLWDVAYSYEPATAEERIEAWCSTGAGTVDGEWSRAELEEHVRDEHSTYTWLLEATMERVGFTITSAEYSDDGIDAKYVLRAGHGE